jgi:cation diffusion facilitator family transporter
MAPTPEMCRRCSRVVPWTSLWGNLGLGVYKLVVGVFGMSAALVADAMHSFADVVGSSGILVATKISSREPSESYPYGLGKAEFLGAAFVYTLLLFFAGGIIYHASTSILAGNLEAPHFVTLLGAIISVGYNYVMYMYATCVGMRNHSPAILADAFENRADAISSVACIAGIGGAMFLHPVCDPIAALLVGVVIFWNCQQQLREASQGLMDRALPRPELEAVRKIAERHPDVVSAASIRTRRTGSRYWVDLELAVSPELAIDRADAVVADLRAEIRKFPSFHHLEVYLVPAAAEA